jgi:hypothetical protein
MKRAWSEKAVPAFFIFDFGFWIFDWADLRLTIDDLRLQEKRDIP